MILTHAHSLIIRIKSETPIFGYDCQVSTEHTQSSSLLYSYYFWIKILQVNVISDFGIENVELMNESCSKMFTFFLYRK